MVWRQGQLDLRLDNASSKPVSEESDLPSWKCNVPMAGRRGLAFDVVGDGSGAVLLAVLQAGGRRDYAIRIDFTGPRRVVIPNGEASWAEGCWGWRFPAKQFDYQASISRMSLGFGSVPAKTSSHVVVTGITLLDNLQGILRDPVFRLGSGTLQLKGEILAGEYLSYSEAEGGRVYDRNWNFLRKIAAKPEAWLAPHGAVDLSLDNAAPQPHPWCELQLITRGIPFSLGSAPGREVKP